MCFSADTSSADAAAAASQQAAQDARDRETAREASIKTGMGNIDTAFSGFNDDFYNARAKAYGDYANPQLDDQYNTAKNGLTYALARAGGLDSSNAAYQGEQLRKKYDVDKQAIVDTGLSYANQARTNVEQNRSDLTTQLNASADPDTVAQSAAVRAGGIQAPPAFAPLGDLFANLSAVGANYNNAALQSSIVNGTSYRPIGATIFGSGSGSGRVVP